MKAANTMGAHPQKQNNGIHKLCLGGFLLLSFLLVFCGNKNSASNSKFQINVLRYSEANPPKGDVYYIFEISDTTKKQFNSGDKFDFIGTENQRYTLEFDKYGEVKTGVKILHIKYNEIFSKSLLSGGFMGYMVKVGDSLQEAKSAPTATTSEAATNKTNLTCKLNGKNWTASAPNIYLTYFAGGNKMMDKTGKPYFQIAFPCNQSPDNRQLTINAKNVPGTTGVLKNSEVLFSGSASGDPKNPELQGYQENPAVPAQKTNWVFTITKWEKKSEDKVIMSATFSGKLKGLMGAKDVEFKEGKIENVEITVYTKVY